MNASRAIPPRPGGAPARSHALARAALLGAMVVGGGALSGCAFGLLGHRAGAGAAPRVEPPREPQDIAEARERLTAQPAEPYWHYRLAQFYLAADSSAAAEGALRTALRHEATYAPAIALLSKHYFERGRHHEALELLEPVRSHPEAYPEETRQILLAGLALHHDAVGRTDLAAATLPRVGDPALKRAGPAMVYVALRGDHPDSATGLARETLREDPRSAVNLNNYGITKLRAADPKAARRAFLEAIERDPRLPGPYYNLAILEKYYALDDDAASRWFRDYWKRSHDDPDSLSGVFGADAPAGVAPKGGDR